MTGPQILGYAVVRLRGDKPDLTHATLYRLREDAEHEQRPWLHMSVGERYVVATITTP